MNREILFRGKRKDNREWVFGSLVSFADNGNFILPSNSKAYVPQDKGVICSCEFHEVCSETVCRYTGLTDKNGRKIFEGDIVKEDWGSFKAVIRFGEFESQVLKNIGFNLEWFGGVGYRQDLPYWTDKVEVIGNIFDNPELLEGESNGRA